MKSLSLSLILLFAVTPILRAQSTTAQAPIPPQILSGHTIFVANAGAPNLYNAFTGGPNRPYNTLYAGLQQWNHYQLVSSPTQADLIFEIRAIAPAVVDPDPNGTLIYNPQLILRILDPHTQAVLWTSTANVRAFGRQKSRDKGFDQSVAVLVDQVRQLEGEQLTPTELKAVRANSRMSTAAKAFLFVGIGAAVATAAYIGYAITHRATLSTPTSCIPGQVCPAI